MLNYTGEQPHRYPNVNLTAKVHPDGKLIQLIMPEDFIGSSVAVMADKWGRHRVLLEPSFNGRTVVGHINGDGTKCGKVDLKPEDVGLQGVIPGCSAVWWAKQRENDLLVGNLFTGLCEHDGDEETEAELTIEDALTFVNRWAKDNGATLLVEDGEVIAEVNRRWRGK